MMGTNTNPRQNMTNGGYESCYSISSKRTSIAVSRIRIIVPKVLLGSSNLLYRINKSLGFMSESSQKQTIYSFLNLLEQAWTGTTTV